MRLRIVSVLLVIGLFIISSMVSQWERPTSVLAQSSSPAAPPIEWVYVYGGDKFSVKQTSDQGYIVVSIGGLSSGLIKIDPHGNEQWSNNFYEKVGYEGQCRAGYQTIDGGYFMAGWIRPTGNNPGDAILVKTDSNGNHQWNRTYGGNGDDVIESAQQTNDAGYILAGYSAPVGVNAHDFCLIKTDMQGHVEWNKTYGVAANNEAAYSVQQTSDGGYILAGVVQTPLNPLGSSMDGLVVKTDAIGNMVWNVTIGRPEGNDLIHSIQRTSDGGYIMAGRYDQRVLNGGFWLIKIDSEGVMQWQGVYSDSDPFTKAWGEAWSACQTSDGGYVVTGETCTGYEAADVCLVKTDSDGDLIWNGTYGKGRGRSVIQTIDGGYVIAGDSALTKVMRANPSVAAFTYSPTNASVQQRILFNASASYDLDEDMVSYVWDFDDGNVTTVSSPIISHRYGSPRTYNVTLTITDGEELNSSLSKEVWVRVATYIEMSVINWSYIGFEIGVSGRLYDIFGHYLRNENVTLQWYIGGNTWTPLGWDITNDYGDYAIVWNPPTVTSYTLKVRWSGNQTFHAAENTKTTSIRSIPTRISLGLWSSTSLIGFQVAVGGDLTSDLGGVSNVPVLLSYSVTRGQTWNEITQATTDSDGHYSAVWMPTATGNYLVKAVWTGNSTYPTASKAVSLTVLPFEERNVFSVISNSTVSELSFESTHKELSFIVEGPADTAGYVDVYVANTLIANIEEVEVKLNGTEIEYTASPSLGDSWLIHFTYQHSVHSVAVNLGFETEAVDGGLPYLLYFMLGAAVTALVVGILIMSRRLRRSQEKQSSA